MGGFHIFDLIVVAIIGLAIFGPKALQSIARGAGKGMGQLKKAKDKVLAELPLEELAKVSQKVPMNAQQAIQMLVTPEKEPEKKASPKVPMNAQQAIQMLMTPEKEPE